MKVHPLIKAIFKKRESQNEKLIKNMERYAKEKEIEQQKSKIHGQKPVKGKTNS